MCADPDLRSPFHRQRGQALIEGLVAAIALVPLVLLAIWFGKVQSIQQAGIAASRLLAFECTVRPEDCADPEAHPELADELRRRSFSRTDVPVLTTDRSSDAPSDRNPLWVDRRNRPLIEDFSDVGVRIELESFDAGRSVARSRAGALGEAVMGTVDALSGPGRFGLGVERGLVNARVQVAVSPSAPSDGFRGQLDSIPLRIRANTAILTDAWNASGPYGGTSDTVESRVRRGGELPSLYETSLDARYALTRGFLTVMDVIGLEPSAGAFRYHETDVDLVPPDRIGGARAGSAGAP
ncbi:MAG: hypothetical protein RIS35_2268, partial [Pseudomonadota bacterium]